MKKYSIQQITKAHKLCFANKEFVQKSKLCGCFNCCSIYPASHVISWTQESNNQGVTAWCPNCGIDSVIGDASHEINEEFLSQMNHSWFSNGKIEYTPEFIKFQNALLDAIEEIKPTSQHST
jgi:hypothetical protein